MPLLITPIRRRRTRKLSPPNRRNDYSNKRIVRVRYRVVEIQEDNVLPDTNNIEEKKQVISSSGNRSISRGRTSDIKEQLNINNINTIVSTVNK